MVDDNATTGSIVARTVERQGSRGHRGDVRQPKALLALDAANRNGAAFGLMVVDSQMPTMDGLEMVRQMRLGANGNAPIVMLVTSNGLTTRLNAIRELGVNHYVVKPVKSHELYAAIADAMAEVDGACAGGRRASPRNAGERFGDASARPPAQYPAGR